VVSSTYVKRPKSWTVRRATRSSREESSEESMVNREMQNGDGARGGGGVVVIESGLLGGRHEMHRSDGSRAALSWQSGV
jgi:hypothetical protein